MTEEKIWDNSENEKFEHESEITIFDPRGIPKGKYKQSYPELNRHIEFQNRNESQMRFVWWFANPTSPLVLNESYVVRRSARAYYKVWGLGHSDVKLRRAMCEMRFGEDVKIAVEKMATFDVNSRYRANKIVDKTFEDIEIISKLTKEDFADDKDVVDYTKFLTAKKMALAILPELLKIKEEGFSIKEKKKKGGEEENGQQNINTFLNDKKDEQ